MEQPKVMMQPTWETVLNSVAFVSALLCIVSEHWLMPGSFLGTENTNSLNHTPSLLKLKFQSREKQYR